MKNLVADKSRLKTLLIAIVVLFTVGVIGLVLSARYIAKALVVSYSDPIPQQLPTIQISRGEVKQLKQKWETFKEALRDGANSERLELSAKELNVMLLTDPEINKFQGKVVLSIDHQNVINALLSSDESLQYLKGNFHVEVRKGRIYADLSLPLEAIGLGEYGNRYVNARGEIIAKLRGQKLTVNMIPSEISGKELPAMVLDRVKELDLYELFVAPHPVYGRLGARIKSLEVDGDRIYLELTEEKRSLNLLPGLKVDRGKKAKEAFEELKDLKDEAPAD